MTHFADLWRSHLDLPPGEQQSRVAREFPTLLSRSPLRMSMPGASIPSAGKRLLIGVAPYSIADLRLLDLLTSATGQDDKLRIDVFDVTTCRTQHDFEKYIPGIGEVLQTPVVGLWQHGQLADKGTGYLGRQIVARECELDAVKLEQLWIPVSR